MMKDCASNFLFQWMEDEEMKQRVFNYALVFEFTGMPIEFTKAIENEFRNFKRVGRHRFRFCAGFNYLFQWVEDEEMKQRVFNYV